MYPSIRHFTQALLTPDLSFRTLCEARAVTDGNGMPRLCRTTRFAEAEIRWNGRRWLLSMPLHPSAMHRIERLAAALRRIHSPALSGYRILPQELQCGGVASDLVLQEIPEGRPFAEMPQREYGAVLLAAIDALEAELQRVGFVHGNLKPSNLIWSGGRFYPVRYHDAAIGVPGESDARAFEALREQIRTATGCDALHDAAADYAAGPRLAGHLWAGSPFEGLVCVEDETGYGYVDTDNRPVIAAQYLWAGDFHEGRAEVETATGMGLIDRTGRYILPPCYEIVEYDPATSRIRARRGGQWAAFDYTGRQLTEFETIQTN